MTIVYFIIGLIAILAIIGLLLPKSYTVSVSEVVNVPRQKVYDFVRILDNQKKFSVWVMEDPNLNPIISGTDGTVGATQSWNSSNKNVGEGEQEITAISPDRMDVDLRFKRPMEGNAKASYLFKPISDAQTELVAEFYSQDKFPMNLMSFTIGKAMIKKAQTQNLKNIKRILEE